MPEPRNITRSLRFTLTAVYTLAFTLVLVSVTLLFRQYLSSSLDQQTHDRLEENWAVVKAYLRIDSDPGLNNYHDNWHYDDTDTDEIRTVTGVQSVLLITDDQGHVLKSSTIYDDLGKDSLSQIHAVLNSPQALWRTKRDSADRNTPYLIRASWVYNDQLPRRKFYVAIGTSLADSTKLLNKFTLLGIGLIPLVILTGAGMGWVFAGRALTPVLQIARTARRISGSNLSLRIPTRGAGDELDVLITTFNQMIERIEVNFNQVRQFSTDVSHELRTPITIVRGQLEVALFTAKSIEQYREAIITSLSDIERLAQIVRALLLLSQAETGQVVLQKQELDLVQIAEGIVDQFQIPAEGGEVKLEFIAECQSCLGDFDRVQIERMLSNLLSNSIKFTPAGGEVRVTIGRREDQAEIEIEDTGQGIAPEHLPHIFDRFYRVRGQSEQASPEKGLGLGLSFVAWIVRAHGGEIQVRSEPGKGTKFLVTLPLNLPALPQSAVVGQAELSNRA